MEHDGLDAPFATDFQRNAPRSNKRAVKRVIVVLLIFLLVGAIGIGATKFMPQEKKVTPTFTPTPTIVFPTDVPTETPVPEKTPAPTPTTAVNSLDKASGLDRSDITVAIQNGSGAVGAASKASDVLKGFGYHVTSLENAENFNFEKTVLQVKTTKATYLPLLRKDLSTVYAIGSSSATLSASASADALVIVGKE